jgi:creatine kinase
MPEECPDLSKHNSYFADVLKANPGLYKELKDKKTKLGVTLGHCIKTGIDNPGKFQKKISSEKCVGQPIANFS